MAGTPSIILPEIEAFEARQSKKMVDDESITECTQLNRDANKAAQNIVNQSGFFKSAPADLLIPLDGILKRRQELGCSNPEIKSDRKVGMNKP